jgi:hypothetical protein
LELIIYFLKNRYFVFLFLLFAGLTNVFGQSANNGTVSGKLIDGISGEQIDFAGIAIIPVTTAANLN